MICRVPHDFAWQAHHFCQYMSIQRYAATQISHHSNGVGITKGPTYHTMLMMLASEWRYTVTKISHHVDGVGISMALHRDQIFHHSKCGRHHSGATQGPKHTTMLMGLALPSWCTGTNLSHHVNGVGYTETVNDITMKSLHYNGEWSRELTSKPFWVTSHIKI